MPEPVEIVFFVTPQPGQPVKVTERTTSPTNRIRTAFREGLEIVAADGQVVVYPPHAILSARRPGPPLEPDVDSAAAPARESDDPLIETDSEPAHETMPEAAAPAATSPEPKRRLARKR